jgi:uncharacterized spore protein YtfJ
MVIRSGRIISENEIAKATLHREASLMCFPASQPFFFLLPDVRRIILQRSSLMGSVALLQSLRDSILGQAGVKAVYGEPISAQGKTVIPVAKLTYGYGAGAGTGGVGNSSAQGEGGGGGAGVRAIPVGVIEVSQEQTRFIPITSRRKLAGAVFAGIVLGLTLSLRRRRH